MAEQMASRDRTIAAVSWWVGLVGLVAWLMVKDLHPIARHHCVAGFVANAGFGFALILLNIVLPEEISWVFSTACCCFLFVAVLLNTVAALMGRDVFFLDAIAAWARGQNGG